jgi:hypothetical protein
MTGMSRAGFAAAGVLVLLSIGLGVSCASTSSRFGDGSAPGAGGGAGADASTAGPATTTSPTGSGVPPSLGDGGNLINVTFPDGAVVAIDSGSGTTSFVPTHAIGIVDAPDCPGCMFPAVGAPACAGAPAITLVYPNDNVLIPPNMGVVSVQWKASGGQFSEYEVDFGSPPNTDWRIITKCSAQYQTTDMQVAGAPATGGCDLPIQGASWAYLSQVNRAGNPVSITVRGTTDGSCATASTNTIHMSFAQEDLLGTYYYWKSTISSNGVGGQIWSKIFGDPGVVEKDVTTAALPGASCNGCHSLSRDGSRMVVYSDDDDSDDEYSDVAGSELDMTKTPAVEFAGGVAGKGGNGGGGQPPGFTAIDPLATYYVTSNGIPCLTTGACKATNGYPAVVGANQFSVWNGANGTFFGAAAVGTLPQPTMPDWSIDGKTVVYVVPAGNFNNNWRKDDAHIFGGSLYTVPYTGNGTFGVGTPFLQSAGENNYYPSYSPDAPMSYIVFNRVASAGSKDACAKGFCPDDSFSNPAARLMLIGATAGGGTPIDLEKANGSPAAMPIPWSNSYPRWAPFVQTYKGGKILWFTFSSTRDYGLRILNHKVGMYQCYPADSAELPGSSHHGTFAPQCQEPQLWMAPITFSEGSTGKDPSFPAFWIPYQDMTTHNHTAQWTQQAPIRPPPVDAGGCTCSNLAGVCGAANPCGCCGPNTTPPGLPGLICSGSNTCIQPAM